MEKTINTQFNLSTQALIDKALSNKEGVLCHKGSLTVETGKRTGRSPKDRFIVKDDLTEQTVDWGVVNQSITHEIFQTLWGKVANYLSKREHFTSYLQVGADDAHCIPVSVTTETASHHLFTQHMFIKSTKTFSADRTWTLMSAPNFTLDPIHDGTNSDGAVIINLTERKVLLCGMRYAGEMKKAMFSVMNFWMPDSDVLPMHCAANVGEAGDVALFFGLSGTGKTTLSADPKRYLIGDDEHGWSSTGVFNFEGGCYAKCIDLSQENEPVIWNAIREGAIMENVVLDTQGKPDFTDTSLTQNTRVAYPRQHIEKRVLDNKAGTPTAVCFLTCDLYGVLPPIALLSKEQAAYYFLSGYTALVGSTEIGSSSAIKPTFSRCFGAPFFPRDAAVYSNLLMKRIEETDAQVYLINTGWTNGAYGEGGHRFDIPTTRAIVQAAISGSLKHSSTEILPGFGLKIPKTAENIDPLLLDPRNSWEDKAAYQTKANILIDQFTENFKQYNVAEAIKHSGPKRL